jgi:hypothetical protein
MQLSTSVPRSKSGSAGNPGIGLSSDRGPPFRGLQEPVRATVCHSRQLHQLPARDCTWRQLVVFAGDPMRRCVRTGRFTCSQCPNSGHVRFP